MQSRYCCSRKTVLSSVLKFDKPPCCYWSESAKISNLQRRVLIYSAMYYRMNASVVSDYDYDSLCYQLAGMQKEFEEEAKKSRYYYAFYDFEGYTGFHLMSRLTESDSIEICNLAEIVYSYWLENTTQEEREMIMKGIMDAKAPEVKKYL